MPKLVEPTTRLHESFLAAMNDFIAEGRGAPDEESVLARDIRQFSARWSTPDGFGDFVETLAREGDPAVPPSPGLVHSTTYWWAEGEDYLGSIRIRHSLTKHLLEVGGHIGYDIAPRARHRGHGTAMLRAALPIASALGVNPALITCDDDNVGSRKIIEFCGGVLDDQRHGKLRFWVRTC